MQKCPLSLVKGRKRGVARRKTFFGAAGENASCYRLRYSYELSTKGCVCAETYKGVLTCKYNTGIFIEYATVNIKRYKVYAPCCRRRKDLPGAKAASFVKLLCVMKTQSIHGLPSKHSKIYALHNTADSSLHRYIIYFDSKLSYCVLFFCLGFSRRCFV